MEEDNMPMPSPAPFPSPTPAPFSLSAPTSSPPPTPRSYGRSYTEDTQQQQSESGHASWSPSDDENSPEREEYSQLQHSSNEEKKRSEESFKAAADLISTLDSAYAEVNSLNATSAREADEARTQARTAAELARRYATRSHPREGSTLSFERYASSSQYKGRAPMTDVRTNPFSPSTEQNREGPSPSSMRQHTTSPHHYPRTPPSIADRIAKANAEDVLALSLELERTKQKLEAEQMSHDETKNLLAEERSKNNILQQKIQKIESSMETQREQLGRTGDALEQELQRAELRVKAAEEDAELALEIAKENAESRDQLETMLQQALDEIETLRNASNQYGYPAIEGGTSKSSLKSVDEENESASKRSVHFSDPISYSQEDEEECAERRHRTTQSAELQHPRSTPVRPTRALVSAGRRLLALSLSSSDDDEDITKQASGSLLEDSAERRRRLREEFKQLDSNVDMSTPPSPRSSTSPPQRLLPSTRILESCRATIKILQESGQRLDLDGHCWRGSSSEVSDELVLQSCARQYCQSVEVKVLRQADNLRELESLCSFLEERTSDF